ncbi:hypothetical protein ASD54_08855 [Rhizobium sp. Root149]|uniref:hypothetical protein n=1 Tax=Rhizobium sp. Root149 TaxID=1736473 RepID=UPI0007156C8A|nr:hypothetical protein [Rhizobium sp. Root149]KQZ50353.1 hypothetical protein ASD54_08855 [Rhizobium sp. Root149]
MLDFDKIQDTDTSHKTSSMHGYDDHWLEDPTRDMPLGFRCEMVDNALADVLKLPAMQSKIGSAVLRLVAANIVMSAKMYPGRSISYSRTDAFYKNRRQYLPKGVNLANVTAAIDTLDSLGYIVNHKRRPPGPRGRQSSFTPHPSLSMLLQPIVLSPNRPEIVMKDKDGNVVPYKESGRVHDVRNLVRKVNKVLEATEIVLAAEGIVEDGPWLRKGNHVMYPALKTLYRVYNGGWTLGGRFYGGWWQGVKSDDRQYFLLNGERTEEIDYSQIHPRIIYLEAGVELVGDAYDIPGYDRGLCKAAFNILINASCYKSASGAVAKELDGDFRTAEAVIEAIKRRHRGVESYFHSNVGIRLQGLDARMAEIVLTEMTVKRGIPVLPVHDSFIVPESHKEALIQVMKDAFERVMGKVENREKIVKSTVANTATRTEAYANIDYKRDSSCWCGRWWDLSSGFDV